MIAIDNLCRLAGLPAMHPAGGTVRGLRQVETVAVVRNDDGTVSKEYQVLHHMSIHGEPYTTECMVEHIDLTKHTPGEPYSPRRSE